MKDRSDIEPITPAHRDHIIDSIKSHGWAGFVIHECAAHHDPDFIPFAYTVGLTDMGLPEIIISGPFRMEVVGSLVNGLIEYWKKHGVFTGRNFDIYGDKDGNDLPCEVRRLDTGSQVIRHDFAVQLFRYYRDKPEFDKVKLYQLCWSDTEGALPNDKGYRKSKFPQQLLPASNHLRGVQ